MCHHASRGVVRQRWQPLTSNLQCDVELALDANHVMVNNEQKSRIKITDDEVMDKYTAVAAPYTYHGLLLAERRN